MGLLITRDNCSSGSCRRNQIVIFQPNISASPSILITNRDGGIIQLRLPLTEIYEYQLLHGWLTHIFIKQNSVIACN